MLMELVLGERDSGKSMWAERRILEGCVASLPIYVATLPRTQTFSSRILKHRLSRRNAWRVLEVDRSLDEVFGLLEGTQGQVCGVLLDGLSAYLSRRANQAQTVGRDFRQYMQSLSDEYGDFLARLTTQVEKLCIVSTIISRDRWVELELSEAERFAFGLNLELCEMTARSSAATWLFTEGCGKPVTWEEILEFCGPNQIIPE